MTNRTLAPRPALVAIAAIACLVLAAPAAGQPGPAPRPTPPPDFPAPPPVARWYQHNQFEWIVPFEAPGPVVSFAVDTPGHVTGVLATPHTAGGYSPESLAIGGLWLNGRPAVEKLWVTDGPMAPLVLSRMGTVPFGALPVARGDVVTITLGDGATGSPTWPETTWVLEVQQ